MQNTTLGEHRILGNNQRLHPGLFKLKGHIKIKLLKGDLFNSIPYLQNLRQEAMPVFHIKTNF